MGQNYTGISQQRYLPAYYNGGMYPVTQTGVMLQPQQQKKDNKKTKILLASLLGLGVIGLVCLVRKNNKAAEEELKEFEKALEELPKETEEVTGASGLLGERMRGLLTMLPKIETIDNKIANGRGAVDFMQYSEQLRNETDINIITNFRLSRGEKKALGRRPQYTPVILYGPAGCGKTEYVYSTAKYLQDSLKGTGKKVHVVTLDCSNIAGDGYVGGEEQLIEMFFKRVENFLKEHPNDILFLHMDEFEQIVASGGKQLNSNKAQMVELIKSKLTGPIQKYDNLVLTCATNGTVYKTKAGEEMIRTDCGDVQPAILSRFAFKTNSIFLNFPTIEEVVRSFKYNFSGGQETIPIEELDKPVQLLLKNKDLEKILSDLNSKYKRATGNPLSHRDITRICERYGKEVGNLKIRNPREYERLSASPQACVKKLSEIFTNMQDKMKKIPVVPDGQSAAYYH